MKRFTAVTAIFSVSILAVWVIFQAFNASQPQAKDVNTPAEAQPAHNKIMKAIDSGNEAVIPVTSIDARKIAPLFDANGSVVSDPSGMLLNAGPSDARAVPVTGTEMNVAPVYDASGAVVFNPSGILLNAPNSQDQGNIAPVFDSNGTVVSDPSATILNGSNP